MTVEEQRVHVASLLRELGHDFITHELTEEQLAQLARYAESMSALVAQSPVRERRFSAERFETLSSLVPSGEDGISNLLMSDSLVSGGANPMGLGTSIRRDGDVAVMEVTLGRAFEGPPGRAHGGAIAALFDEAMGLVNMLNNVLAYTAKLNISYRAPTPLGEPLIARSRLTRREGRKFFVEATLRAGDTVCATATALFIAVEPRAFAEAAVVDGA